MEITIEDMKQELKKYNLTTELTNDIIDFCLEHPELNSQMSWRTIRDDSYHHIMEGTFSTFCEAINFFEESVGITQKEIVNNVKKLFIEKSNESFGMDGNDNSQAQYMTFVFTTMTTEEFEEAQLSMYM